MSFDQKKIFSTATNSDIADIAIDLALALTSLQVALLKISTEAIDLSPEVKVIKESAESIHKKFRDLTGWTPDGG